MINRSWRLNAAASVATGIVAVAALVMVVVAAVAQPRGDRGHRAGPPERVSNWEAYEQGGHRVGPSTAKVTIVVFEDFQCRYCRDLSHALRAVGARHPTDVAIVYHHFPLDRKHPEARAAAVATECAADQDRFVELRQMLYRNQRAIGVVPWSTFAVRGSIPDTSRFLACLNDSTELAAVNRDVGAGHRLGVTGTPTVIVDGWRLHETPTAPVIEAAVARALGGREHAR